MIRPPWVWLVAVLAAALPSATVRADGPPSALVRVGTHQGYSRIAFNFSTRTEYSVARQGDRVTVQFADNAIIGAANAIPRNVVSIIGGTGRADIVVAAGTTVRDWRAGNLVVIDIAEPEAAADAKPPPQRPGVAAAAPTNPSPPALSPAPAVTAPQTPPPGSAAPETTKPQPQPAPQAAPPAAPAELATPDPMPASAQVPTSEPSPSPAAPPGQSAAGAEYSGAAAKVETGLVVPASAQVGLAAFRRGNVVLIVLDQPRSIDLSPWRDDPLFGAATVQTLQTATVLRLPLDSTMALSPSRTRNAWRIAVVPLEPALRPIQASVADDRLVLRAMQPGSVVSVLDPDTGAALLVGTQRQQGQGVPAMHRAAEFNLLPTWQGVAIEPNADTVALRAAPQGFVVAGISALSPQSDVTEQLTRSVSLTRHFDFPNQPTETLLRLLQRQVTEDAATAPLARGPRRQAMARTMIALGLGAEASALLGLAASDDPRLGASPENAALASIAALLAHRAEDAAGIADPRLPASDDVALWRAVRLAQLSQDSAAAAATLAATLPLVLAYPPELRDRLLPLVAETLVTGGETAAAAALLDARKDDQTLDLARAMLQEARGDSVGALAGYDRLERSRDQSLHARAATRAVEVRLATGAFDAKQAADRLESLMYAWRGDARERALRSRLADLEARGGAWRSALALLRDSETLFPQEKAEIHGELTDLFASLLRDDKVDLLAPLELVSLVEENADLLPQGAEGDALQGKLADRLVALDLPKRAAPVLEKLVRAAPSGVARAGFGARLAALRLREADLPGAMAALEASVAGDLPSDLVERRALLAAAISERRGDPSGALAALAASDSTAASEARATILERSNDWPGAVRALTDYVARSVPPEGRLDEPQRQALLRLATAAARAGDDAVLAAVRQRETARMGSGPLADLFRLLTAEQVRSTADLRRSAQEAALARDLPGQLRSLPPPLRQTP